MTVPPEVAERVRDAVASLISALDGNDAEEFASWFCVDGSLYATGRGTTRGHQALRTYVERTASGRPVHVLTSVLRIVEEGRGTSASVPFALVDAGTGAFDARGDLCVTIEMDEATLRFSSVAFSLRWASPAYLASGRCAVE